LASPVPVIAWVGPQGARAASAGTYILYATHLAAMAPATSVGAATPVSMGGGAAPDPGGFGGGGRRDGAPGEDGGAGAAAAAGAAMARKALKHDVAYLRGLATLRGRDVDFAERAVREGATMTPGEALEAGVIVLVAPDVPSLLQAADGRAVQLPDGEVRLRTARAPVTEVEPAWRGRLL